MRRSAPLVLLLSCGIGAAHAAAQGPSTVPGAAAGDIREVFLALPVPPAGPSRPVLALVRARVATRALRESALQQALASRYEFSQIHPRDGYLDLCVPAPREADCLGRIVLTYFNQANGDRLVVMQVESAELYRTEDYFWRLAGGTFTPLQGPPLLPDLTWTDFWGSRPRPSGLSPRFFRDSGALRIRWPRQGTTALAVLYPLRDASDRRSEELDRLYEQRRFTAVELVWDRRRGVFTKGRSLIDDPELEEEHDHH